MQAPNVHLDGRALNPDGPSTSSQICAAGKCKYGYLRCHGMSLWV